VPGLGISTGMYKPPSGAIPRRTASRNVTGSDDFGVETPVSVLGVCDVLDIRNALDIGNALDVLDVRNDALTDCGGVWEAE
jgi:hypothetical protein